MTTTIACPEQLIPIANQLALILGEGQADAYTFRGVGWVDGAGNRYSVASWNSRWLSGIDRPLQAPEWEHDINLGEQARALVVVGGTARPDRIVIIDGPDASSGISQLGLTPSE